MLPLLLLTLRDLNHHRGRAILTVIGLTGISFSYVILGALSESMVIFGNQETQSSNLVIIPNNIVDPIDGVLEEGLFQTIADLTPELVEQASYVLFKHLRIGDHVVQLRAAPLADWEAVHHLTLSEGAWPDGAGEVAISEGAAHFAQWAVGQPLQIYGSEFRVSGIFSSSGTKFSSVWLPIEEAHRLFGQEIGYQLAYVQVAGGIDGETARLRLESDPRIGERYDVYLEDRFNARYTELIGTVRNLTVIITGIALLGISFGTFNAANLGTTERAQELAILRAIGFSPATERAYLLLRAGLQSVWAYALGVSAAAIFVAALQAREPVELCGVCLPFKLTLANILVGLGLVLILAQAGAWFSSRKRMRLTVAQLLSHQGAQGA